MHHVITGATSGIGQAVAQSLHERGDELTLLVRDPARVIDLPRARVVVADLADPAALVDLDLPDRVDSLIHCAGVVTLGRVEDVDVAVWQQQLTINLVAPAALTSAVLPALRATGGTVVFINSGAGLRADAEWGGYAASKFGLRALADSLRAEEPLVRVTTVFPGRTATPMQAQVHEQEGREYDPSVWIDPATVATAIVRAIDLSPDAVMPELVLRPQPRH